MKYREKSDKGNFGGDILSISTDFRYFGDISTEISEILFPGYKYKFCIRISSVTPTEVPNEHKSVISISSG